MHQFWDEITLAFLALLPVLNPFAKPPIFLSITEGLSDAERRSQAFKACVWVAVILLTSLAAGDLILRFFSITLPALQIAGGLMIARTAFQMLNPQREHHQTAVEEQESRAKPDVSFVPLALPLLSGPGAIAVMIGLATSAPGWTQHAALAGAALAVTAVCYLVLRESVRLVRVLGENGINALSKLMGFLLLSLAVQFVINGVLTVAESPELRAAWLARPPVPLTPL